MCIHMCHAMQWRVPSSKQEAQIYAALPGVLGTCRNNTLQFAMPRDTPTNKQVAASNLVSVVVLLCVALHQWHVSTRMHYNSDHNVPHVVWFQRYWFHAQGD
jgi:hypothetical protein